MIKKTICLSSIIALLLSGAACRSRTSLSRSEASALIKTGSRLPVVETTSLGKKYFSDSRADDANSSMPTLCIDSLAEEGISTYKQTLDALKSKGLIEFGKNFVRRKGRCNYIYATVDLTSEGRKYLLSESADAYVLKAYEIGFGEVTGVQVNEQFKAAQADYTLVVSGVSPFARNTPASPIRRTAAFALYDDGWRLQN